jgi:hypothetical protein
MDIFELEHIFVVFQPGAAGNFIVSLLEKILNRDTNTINVGESGTAHTLINRKIEGTDYLSFGTEVIEHEEFDTEEERIDFYLSKIKTEYVHVTSPQIIWTHDFTNIPIYKRFFPKAKILTITQESDAEKIAVVLLHVIKNILDLNTINPLTEKRMIEVRKIWDLGMKMKLGEMLGEAKARTLNKDSNLIRYVSFSRMMSYYRLNNLVEENKKQVDLVNTVLYPAKGILMLGKIPYTIGKEYAEYTDNCTKLPFKYLMDNDTELLINSLSQLIELDDERIKIILSNYDNYRSVQNQEILEDPLKYYNKIKEEGYNELKRLELIG